MIFLTLMYRTANIDVFEARGENKDSDFADNEIEISSALYVSCYSHLSSTKTI